MLLRLVKEINRLIRKEMSNIYLKFTIEKNQSSQNFHFPSFKSFASMSAFGELQLTQISLNLKTSWCKLKIRDLGEKCGWLFYYFNFARNYGDLMPKSPCFLLNKNISFNKNEIEFTLLKRQVLCFNSYRIAN